MNIFFLFFSLIIFIIIYYIFNSRINLNSITSIIIILILFWIITIIIKNPKESIQAAYSGLSMWFNIVIPSLLPFFIISEILIGLGVVNLIGNLLEPIISRLFNVPGEGSFVFAMSIVSGYPVGVKLVSNLRNSNSISKIEAQRLVSFCSTSGPLFMIGAVSIGMLNNSNIVPIILLAHYISAILVGFIFRFYKSNNYKERNRLNKNIIKNSFIKLKEARKEDGRAFGKLMSDSVKSSIESMLMIGGFIILYAVIINFIKLSSIDKGIIHILKAIFPSFNKTELFSSIISGIIEITNGCKLVSEVNTSYILKISSISFLIGWSGFSIHSQAISFLNKTDISIKIYMFSKLLHGIFASILTIPFYNNLYSPTICKTIKLVYINNTQTFSLYSRYFDILKFTTIFLIIITITILIFSLLTGIFVKIISK